MNNLPFENSESNAFRYRELDALRGIAALMVVFFHLTMQRPEADLGFKLGTTGVDLFFIISGFVISMSIGRVLTGGEFVINRVSRLYPTYWTSVTFTFTIILIYASYKGEPIDWIAYLGNLTMFQYYLGIPDLDGPYWTMIIELNFYVFILILFYLRGLRHIVLIGIVLTTSVVITVLFYWNSLTQHLFKMIPLLEFFPLFFSGVIFYRMATQGIQNRFYYLLVFCCLCAQIVLFDFVGRSSTFINQVEYTAMLLMFFGLFILFVNNKLRFIINKPLLFLGKISFALYLTHQYLLIGHLFPLLFNRLKFNFWIAALICVSVAIIIASLITFLVEVPFSKYLKRRLRSVML